MVSMAVSHRQVAVGAYERIARLTGMLCRLGVVLAILQLASWSVVYWDDFDQSEALASARHASRMQAVDNVVAPSVAMLVRSDTASRGTTPDHLEWAMRAVRETTRTLLWGITILLLPLVVIAGLMSPFLRRVDTSRVIFGMLAVLGMIPLARAEAAPVIIGMQEYPPMPDSMLAGLAAPAVALILLAAAAVLMRAGAIMSEGDAEERSAPRISPKELENIIRRGEHPGPIAVRSSRSRKTAQ